MKKKIFDFLTFVVIVAIIITVAACGSKTDEEQGKTIEEYICAEIAPNGEIITITECYGGGEYDKSYIVDVYTKLNTKKYYVGVTILKNNTRGTYHKDDIQITKTAMPWLYVYGN